MMQVEAKSIWEDVDKRRSGRQFKVERIVNGKAVCRVLNPGKSKGKSPVRIRLDRFVSKYYRMVDSGASSPRLPNDSSVLAQNVPKSSFVSTGLPDSSLDHPLTDRCSDFLIGNWTSPLEGYALLEQGPINGRGKKLLRVLVREDLDTKGYEPVLYDVKLSIYGNLIATSVQQSLTGAMDEIIDEMHEVLGTLAGVLDVGVV